MKTLVGKKTVAYNQNGEYFVNPLNKKIQKYEISILKEIAKKYDVDGIILDWLRFDDYKMDLSKSTRNAFKKKYGYDPITISFSTNNAKRRQWNSWRTSQLVYLFSLHSSQNVGRMLENLSRILMLFCQCPITRTGILLLPGFMGKIRVFFTIHKKRQKTPPLFQHLICLHPNKRIVIRQFSKRRKKIILRLNA